MDKKYTYTIIGIVALILIAWAVYSYNHQGDITPNTQQQTNTQTTPDTTTPSTATTTTTTTPASNGQQQRLAYAAAVKAYPFRFQFSGCKGTPASMAVKKGTVVMLDNRTDASIIVKADAQTYNIAGLDYALEKTAAIGNLIVTCNGKNSVTLNVQK